MFYDKQPEVQREKYKKMLAIVGSLSNVFSESDEPMLYYRAHENIFCKYFNAENLSREDCSADASKDFIGIGLKTWVGRNDQKVAEFGRLRPEYEDLTDIDLIKKIAEYRNTRIKTTMKAHGLKQMIYHIVKRVPSAMIIYESEFEYIDIDKIVIINNSRANANNTYFTDGKHTYHFSLSKNTLYMIFDQMVEMDSFDVHIYDDPYEILKKIMQSSPNDNPLIQSNRIAKYPQICLRLYSTKKDLKFVAEKSGINQWNAGGRKRDPNEIYIPFPVEDRKRNPDFFPPRDEDFDLRLPDGSWIVAKICQDSGKAIMSNPNKVLGNWLLRNVFDLPEGTVITYPMLKIFGVDCVVFSKLAESERHSEKMAYSVDFGTLGTYERFYNLDDIDSKYDAEHSDK